MRVLFAALMGLLYATAAHATVIKDIPAPEGVPRTGIVIVGVNTFQLPWELGNLTPILVANDAEARKLAESFKRMEGVHYVDMLTGSEATTSGVKNAIARATGEQLARFIFAYRGFGIGEDAGAQCFMLADWNHEEPEQGCLAATDAALLMSGTAPWQLAILDASINAQEVLGPVLAMATFGPTADTWPGEMPVISSSKSREYATCNVLWPVIRQILDESAPDASLAMGELVTEITSRAARYAEGRCLNEIIHPRADGKWFSDDVVIPDPTPPKPEPPPVVTIVVTPEPLQPPPIVVRPKRTIGTDTKVLIGVTAACGVTSLVSGLLLNSTMQSMATDEDIVANYEGQADLSAAAAKRPLYGWTMTGSAICAGGSALAAGLTVAF